ncbi:RNA polymerase sigma factor [Catenuloplanes atrovinosus]|uniref:RNA polymerase sigma-70 factor (ECF subfamily) n=1 Tax=Catenuloplanes atrovinosus TaxID=137266 RepID=A0AAE3YKM3_9ACTN|nr:sigma-70 family RNA polymerase sigma factor [Catenuloplanes atrovinosus]MDR7275539.1 RNA polymerase sigma-70 factor (ECF subfamily) [Catenuloplanes atrovinosus]
MAEGTERRIPFDDYFRARFTSLIALLVKVEAARFDEAEDAAAAAMSAAHPLWDTIIEPDKWVWRVARNHFLKVRLRERRRTRRLWEMIDHLTPKRDCSLPDDESEELVLDLVGRLPKEQRAVMAFTYDGWSPAEIAELLEKDPQTVRSTLRQARTAVRRMLTGQDDGPGQRGPR